MKKIDYFNNCKQEYLISLGLLKSDKNEYTEDYKILNKKWQKLRKEHGLNFTPKKVSKLITANFDKLIIYFEKFDKFIDSRIQIQNYYNAKNVLKKREYNNARKSFLLKYINIFKYSINKDDILKEYSDIQDFSEKIGQFFIDNASKLDIKTCFYCETTFSGIFKIEKEIRRSFDLDHFFPKEQYPLFSISLYNFIPSCTICNSRIKGSSYFKNFYKLSNNLIKQNIDDLKFLSPSSACYDLSNHTKITINPCCPPDDKEWKFSNDINMYEISFDVDESTPYKKAIEAFNLKERYNTTSIKLHSLYLYQLKINNPDEHIYEIAKILSDEGFPTTPQEIKNKVLHLDEESSLLQKLKTDILND